MEQKLRRDLNMGDNLRKLRLDYGVSQEKLCAELQRHGCDIGRSTYEKYEMGELNIRISVLVALHKIYSCSYDAFLMDWTENKSKNPPEWYVTISGGFLIQYIFFKALH